MTTLIHKQIQGQLIVSCQALEHEPLHGSEIMGKMALAATQSGAGGIRANSVNDIKAIKQNTALPIIGIIKQNYGENPVYITPTMTEIDALVAEGVQIIAMAATDDQRPNGQTLTTFFTEVKQKYPQQLFMADVSTLGEAKIADQLGFDFVGPTLLGYTKQSAQQSIEQNDFALLKELIATISVPIIAEGGIITPELAKRVLDLGAFAVVVGGAITRPQQITARFVQAMKG